jgi:hypothetical protein
MSDTRQYGRYYWCAKVSSELSKNGEIYVMADEVKIDRSGAVYFFHTWKEDDGSRASHPNLILAAGQWTAVYAASMMDGAAVAVERWKGEVDRG